MIDPATPRPTETGKLKARIAFCRANGLEYILLVKSTSGGNSPKNWTRCRVMPGKPALMGRCVGAGQHIGQWLFEVTVDELEAWMKGGRRG
jgi:hypothetical protein